MKTITHTNNTEITEDLVLEAACRLEADYPRRRSDYNTLLCLGLLCTYNEVVGRKVGPRHAKYGACFNSLHLPSALRHRHKHYLTLLQQQGLAQPNENSNSTKRGTIPTPLGMAVYEFLQICNIPQIAAYRQQLLHRGPTLRTHRKHGFAEKKPRGRRSPGVAPKPPRDNLSPSDAQNKNQLSELDTKFGADIALLIAALRGMQHQVAQIEAMLLLQSENDVRSAAVVPAPPTAPEHVPAPATVPEQPPSTPVLPETSEYVASRSSYRGYPTMVINGPRLAGPLMLGTTKLRAIQAVWPSVQTFLAEQAAQTESIAAGHEPRQQENAQGHFNQSGNSSEL